MPQLRDIPHPIVRDGRSQSDRRERPALLPEFVKAEGRSDKQFLAYLNEFAKSVAHYDETNGRLNNWQDFFRTGSSVQLALINTFETDGLQKNFTAASSRLTTGLDRGNYAPLLDFLFEAALRVNAWHKVLQEDTAFAAEDVEMPENPLRQTIANIIFTNMRTALYRLIALANTLNDVGKTYDLPNLNDLKNTNEWELTALVLSARDAALRQLAVNPNAFRNTATTRINEIFGVFYNATRQIVADTEGVSILQNHGLHEPHLGLLYAFLKLFSFVQDDLNRLPKRHLDFYYKKVLGLGLKTFTPDAVHVVFELNNPIPQLKIPKNALVKDGKDALKSDIRFALADELIVSRTQVATLRTLFNGRFSTKTNDTQKIFAAPIANSADGAGAEFKPTDDTSWATLGTAATPLSTEMPSARLGLLVASPALRLAEGERTVTLTLKTEIPKNLEELFTNKNTSYTITNENQDTPILTIPATFWDFVEITGIFDISVTGKKGWFKPKGVTIKFLESSSVPTDLEITFTLTSKDEPIVVADPSVLKADFGIEEPLIKMELNQTILRSISSTQKESFYTFFSQTLLTNATLNVDVKGAKNIIIQTDEGAQDATKPFMPFSAQPSIGSSFYFGSDEAFRKNLTLFKLTSSWDKLPSVSFLEYYKGYGEIINDNTFNAVYQYFGENKWNDVAGGIPLFHTRPLMTFQPLSILEKIGNSKQFNAALKENLVRFSLVGHDFYHSQYPKKLAEQLLAIAQFPTNELAWKNFKNAIDAIQTSSCTNPDCLKNLNLAKTEAQNIVARIPSLGRRMAATDAEILSLNDKIGAITCDNPDCAAKLDVLKKATITLAPKPKDMLNPPYTPILKDLSLDYSATDTEGEGLIIKHLYPFEETNRADRSEGGGGLLPRFYAEEDLKIRQKRETDKQPIDTQGTLLLGLKDAKGGQILDLFFQVNESSANPYLEKAVLKWAYLAGGNIWKPLVNGHDILSDDTDGLIRSGIVKLVLPFDLSSAATTILPPQYLWLKVATEANVAAVCRTIGVHTQAAKAVFLNENNDLTRLNVPLVAASATKMVAPLAEIKSIAQPYDSFGGRAPENEAAFYIRVSERLRHKGRAVTLFDYEQLVLEAFPDIYKVKCINHSFAELKATNAQDKHHAPGHVTVVVIPDVSKRAFSDRLEPTVSRGKLAEIERFLKKYTSPFVLLKVMNPTFEKINTAFDVTFQEGKSPDFYKEQLEKDIQSFLSPWAFDVGAKITFSGRLFRSSIVRFVEQQDYVAYLENFKMWHGDPSVETDEIEIVPSTARTVLVSGEHNVRVL